MTSNERARRKVAVVAGEDAARRLALARFLASFGRFGIEPRREARPARRSVASARGASGRDPRMAFQCEAFSVPSFLHTKFIGKLANEHDGHPDEMLLAWYRSIAARYDGQAVPADEVKWLTAEFDAWRKPTTAATADKQELSSEEWGKRMAERIMAKRAADAAKVTA